MGGKTKQSQRTKNNARPASSARSAELLINADPAFSSVGGKIFPAVFPTLAGVNLDQNLSPEFTLCFKKLNKKDPITKTKALQELCELVNKSDVDDVVAALPLWAHHYKRLACDTDHKVREATQVAQGVVTAACGRRCAPALRQLVPAWLPAQYDEYAPAAAAATKALQATFPANKLPEVISFCREELVAHLAHHLLSSPDALLGAKLESAEERELQYTRIVTSCLRGLDYFCEHLPEQHDDWLWQHLATMLQNKNFWKHASHNSAQVRASWYGSLCGVVSRFGRQFGTQFGQKATRLLLAAAHERAGAVADRLWGALLAIMHHVQDWDKWLDNKELLRKRILDMLANGGWGEARHLCNTLLPLLAHLPCDMLTKDFYEAFFDAIFAGLEKKNVMSSKSERQAWLTSLAECLRYLSIQQNDFVVEVATSVHRTWLEKIFSNLYDGQIRSNLIKCSATNMTSIVKYWLKLSNDGNKEKYDQLVRNFWQNLGSTLVTQIEKLSTDQEEITKVLDGHILLLKSLKLSLTPKVKASIKFSDDPQEPEKEISSDYDPQVNQRFDHNLNDLVDKMCSQYFEFADDKQVSNCVLSSVTNLLAEFDSKRVLIAIAGHFKVDSVYGLYDRGLRAWLAGDTMRCKPLVDVVFLLLKYLTEEQTDAVFDSFKQFPPSVVEWCISASLQPVGCAGAARWLRGPLAAQTLLGVCTRLVREGDSRAQDLLLAALSHMEGGELAVSLETADGVVRALCGSLGGRAGPARPHCVAAATRLASALPPHTPHLQPLLYHLFQFNLYVKKEDGRIPEELWVEARSRWALGLRALSGAARGRLRADAVALLHRCLLNQEERLDIENLEHIMSICPYLVLPPGRFDSPDDINEIVLLTQQLFDFKQTETESMEKFALRHDCVASKLNCPFEDDNDIVKAVVAESAETEVKDFSKESFVLYATKLLFRTMFLKALFTHKFDDDDNEESQKQNNRTNALLENKFFIEEVSKEFYDYAVIGSLHETYMFWLHYNMIRSCTMQLDATLGAVTQLMCAGARQRLRSQLRARAAGDGYWWPRAAKLFDDKTDASAAQVTADAPISDHFDIATLQDKMTGSGFFHGLQARSLSASDKELVLRAKYAVMVRSVWAAHAHEPGVADAQFCADAAAGWVHCSADVVVNIYYRHNHTMLYEREIQSCPWAQVVSNAAIADFLAELVTWRGWDMASHHWDFTTITLCSLLTSLRLSKQYWGSTKVSVLGRAVLSLFARVARFVRSVRRECERRAPAAHVAHLPAEWADVFAPDAMHSLFDLLLHILQTSVSGSLTSTRSAVLRSLVPAAEHMDWDALPAARRSGEFALERLVDACTDVLAGTHHHHYKYLAHHALNILAKPLVLEDAEKLVVWSEQQSREESPPPEWSLARLERPLFHLEELAEAALAHVPVGVETCTTAPQSDSERVVLGYLLLAQFLLDCARLPRDDLASHYTQLFWVRKYLWGVVGVCLRLLPEAVGAFALGRAAAPPDALQLFLRAPALALNGPDSGSVVSELACHCLLACVRSAVGAARAARGAGGAEQRALDRLLQAYISPQLIREQLTELHQNQDQLPDTKVTIYWSTGEAECVVCVDERQLPVTVAFSREHPLAPPRVSPAPPPAPPTHWIALYLTYQNGTLLNAMKLWVEGMSRRVERAPQCYICYCRLHPGTGHLPRVHCHQCRNKFHNECLSKWFATSAKFNCPLCRSTF